MPHLLQHVGSKHRLTLLHQRRQRLFVDFSHLVFGDGFAKLPHARYLVFGQSVPHPLRESPRVWPRPSLGLLHDAHERAHALSPLVVRHSYNHCFSHPRVSQQHPLHFERGYFVSSLVMQVMHQYSDRSSQSGEPNHAPVQ